MAVGVAVRVGRGVGVRDGVVVAVGVGEGTAVGGSPSTVKVPEIFQIVPVNNCTS